MRNKHKTRKAFRPADFTFISSIHHNVNRDDFGFQLHRWSGWSDTFFTVLACLLVSEDEDKSSDAYEDINEILEP